MAITDNVTSSLLDGPPYNLGGANFNTLQNILFLCFVIPLTAFTVLSNSFVIHAIATHPPLKIPSNLLLLSLAVTDLSCGLFAMPVAVYYNIVGVWYLGPMACQMWSLTTYYLETSSMYHLCMIALDRYLAIAHPLEYVKRRSYSKAFWVICLIWSGSFAVMLPSLLSDWGMTFPQEFNADTACVNSQNPTLSLYLSITSFFLPMLALMGIYLNVFLTNRARLKKKIKQSSDRLNKMSGCSGSLVAANRSVRLITGKTKIQMETAAAATGATAAATAAATAVGGSSQGSEADSGSTEGRKGSKRKQQFLKMSADLNIKLTSVPTVRCQCCQARIPRRNDNKLCQICSSPNDLLLAAERSRLSILVQRERNSMFVITIIVSTFMFCLMPCYIVFLISNFYPTVSIDAWLISIVWWLSYSNSACNPIIYTVFNEDFRTVFFKIFQ